MDNRTAGTGYRIPKLSHPTPIASGDNSPMSTRPNMYMIPPNASGVHYSMPVRPNASLIPPTGSGIRWQYNYTPSSNQYVNQNTHPDYTHQPIQGARQYQQYTGIRPNLPTPGQQVGIPSRAHINYPRSYPDETPSQSEGFEGKSELFKFYIGYPRCQPEKRKVLLASNVSLKILHHMELFWIFGNYGDVSRIKLVKDNENKLRNIAFIEFYTATFAAIAREMLDQTCIYDEKLNVSFSNYEKIRSEEECGFPSNGKWRIRSFDEPQFSRYRRYETEDKIGENWRRCLVKPRVTLCSFDKNIEFSAAQLKQHLKESGIDVVDSLTLEKMTYGSHEKSRKIILEFDNISDSMMAMTRLAKVPVMSHFNVKIISEEKRDAGNADSEYKIVE